MERVREKKRWRKEEKWREKRKKRDQPPSIVFCICHCLFRKGATVLSERFCRLLARESDVLFPWKCYGGDILPSNHERPCENPTFIYRQITTVSCSSWRHRLVVSISF
jgi:hypothetical protein